jgi:hypothetical protein
VIVYCLWFHLLARYPGLFLARVTNIYGGYYAWRGSLHIDILKCYDEYGKKNQNSGYKRLIF